MEEKEKSLVDVAYERIRQQICDFELVPGQPVSDFILSKSLGMSRTPIRMALQKLEDEHLVEPGRQGHSHVVSGITAEDITDLLDARCGLELTALRLLMHKGISQEDIDYLYKINQRMAEANDAGHIRQQFFYDQKFHDRIFYLSGNTRLNRFNDSLNPQLIRMRVLSYLERSFQDKAYREHGMIIDMIAQNNEARAVEILKDHIVSTKTNYIAILNNRLNTESIGVLSFAMTHDMQ